LQQAIEADPMAVPAYVELGRYYVQTGKPAEAQALYEQALPLDEGNISLLTLLAENAVLLGDAPSAINYWQEIALRDAGRRANAYFQIGSLALKDKNLPSALAFYRQALEIEPENRSFMLGLADTYWEMGCRQVAKRLYEEIVLLATNAAVRNSAQARLDERAGMRIDKTPCVENPCVKNEKS
jgi:tetratricopeptide (TPR) repeat protein